MGEPVTDGLTPDRSSAPDQIRVFVLDDHELVRLGITDFLRASGGLDVVGQAGSVAAAREQIVALAPDVALLDVRLPDGSGIELCRYLQSAAPGVRCLLLTSFDDGAAAAAAVLAGARGFLLKTIHTADLVTAVRRVAADESLLDPHIVEEALDAVRGLGRDGSVGTLTSRLQHVRDLMLEGCSDQQIADRLGLSLSSVRALVAELVAFVLAPPWTS